MSTVLVLGAGRMGTAICAPLLDRGHEVRLVGTHLDAAYVEALRNTGLHPGLAYSLPGHPSYHQFEDLGSAMEGADWLVLGVSSTGVRWASQAITSLIRPSMPVLMVTKGLEWDGERFRLLPDVFVDGLTPAIRTTIHPVAVTGPCVAGELIRCRETCVVFAGRDPIELARWAQGVATDYYHVWTSTDFGGCEACAAFKNAFAIAMGFATGLRSRSGAGSQVPGEPEGVAAHNYDSAVFAEAIQEMRQLVRFVGGNPETVAWLSGVGDLLVTSYARSQRFGRLLGSGLTLAQATTEMTGVTLEGLAMVQSFGTALPVLEASGALLAGQLPLLRHLVEVVSGGQVAVPFGRFFEPPTSV